MHRGRTWTQRQLIGFGTPPDYNQRLKKILAAGSSAGSLIPCNSVYRGFDCDEVDPLLLGTCGTVINTVGDMDRCLDDIDLSTLSMAVNDPLPFTLLAFMLRVAEQRGVPWSSMTGTSNQSDYISHFVANHMFFRLSPEGSRRVLLDHIAFCQERLPRWNPVSIIGQHMQQGGATPAEAMGLALCTAIQLANDCLERGWDPDAFLPRFTFFFDISISFFEEVAKFRAGRRIWQRIVRERFGSEDPRSFRFKFHAQTSGVDLTREQPLNNISRVAAQAIAGIFGGLQSLHTDAYDEALTVPSEHAARIAVQTQNILREEAHLCDVIDPLGGSFYVERLTNEMEARILAVIDQIDGAGGMFEAAKKGIPQGMMLSSAVAFQDRIESGEQVVVGVNRYRTEGEPEAVEVDRPDPSAMEEQVRALKRFKAERDQPAARNGLDAPARAAASPAETPGSNTFAAVLAAAGAGATHGEICTCLREQLGFGDPLIVL
jgi:methylmalonyl-CoA mutase N-terminal domain/subunit